MSKCLLLVLALLGATPLTHAQVADSVKLPVDPTTCRIVYAEVIQVPGASQAELYTRAKRWFAKAFRSSEAIMQTEAKEAGRVQDKAWTPIAVHFADADQDAAEMTLWYTVKLACREGNYRYEITEFETSTELGAVAQFPMEALLASWIPYHDDSSGMKRYKALVAGDMRRGIASNSKGLAISLKEAMAHKPSTTAEGKN